MVPYKASFKRLYKSYLCSYFYLLVNINWSYHNLNHAFNLSVFGGQQYYSLPLFMTDEVNNNTSMNMVRLSLLCSKIYLLFFPEFPKILTHYSYFIPMSSPIIPNYSCNLYASMIIMSIKDHNTHGNVEVNVVSAVISSKSA